MEEATYLSKFASRVHIVHRRDTFRASKIMAERVLENEKIQVEWNSVVQEVLGTDQDGVTAVTIRSTEDESKTTDLEASGYFAAIGHTPNTDFLDGQLQTNESGPQPDEPTPALTVSLPPAMLPTTIIARRSLQPARDACPRWTQNVG